MIEVFDKFFTSPTPSRFLEMTALWHGLSDESKITFLLTWSKAKKFAPLTHLANNFFIFVIESPNPYIRYLAAKLYSYNSVWSKHLDSTVKSKIENDEDLLVRYSLLEEKYYLLGPEKKDFEYLMNLDHQAKLAIVRLGRIPGENMANLITYFLDYGLPNNLISEIELYEIIADYLGADYFHEVHSRDCGFDGWSAFSQSKDLKCLWDLTLTTPKSVSFALIKQLPATDGNHFEVITEELLNKMSVEQLKKLLYREDVLLKSFRKELFFKLCDNINEDEFRGLFSAAISFNFDLEDDEFAQVSRICIGDKLIECLSSLLTARNCRPVIMFVISDYLGFLDKDFSNNWWRDDSRRLKNRIKDDVEKNLISNYILREIRLYVLAAKLMPWGLEKPEALYWLECEELSFLQSHIVIGDTWSTYQSFHKAWHNKYRYDEHKDELLPEF